MSPTRTLPRPPPVRVSPLVVAAALAVFGSFAIPHLAGGADRDARTCDPGVPGAVEPDAATR